MNKVCICGRLTKDPAVKEGDVTIARFTLAVNRRKKDAGADFISCVAFGKCAEHIQTYFHKGMKADITGHIQTGKYDDKDGKTIYTTDVVVEEIDFGESKRAGDVENGTLVTGEFEPATDKDNPFVQGELGF